ncbi:MAG: sigma 54-interacting transcriptional regulator, partial [Thermoanaerobaculia bacterium]|nr:sigma 54-interacting transcriptional regulator [Thermoanaerobaculia bacterium]
MAYRLVDRSEPSAQTYSLGRGENVVGSHPSCEVTIDDPSISRHHAIVVVARDAIEVADLGSENGTRVDGVRIYGQQNVKPGAILTLGKRDFLLEDIDDEDIEIARDFGLGTQPRTVRPPASTASIAPLQRFTAEFLSPILGAISQRSRLTDVANEVGIALSTCLPAIRVEIYRQSEAGPGVLFRRQLAESRGDARVVEDQGVGLAVEFLHESAGRLHAPLLAIAHQLLLLAHQGRDRVEQPPNPISSPPFGPPPWPRPTTLDPVLRSIYQRAEIIAQGRIPVLIRGETGTGKELLARFLHEASPFAKGAFVTLNCAALPRDLQEAELFGIEQGVATGVEARAGKFETAHGGSLFLDEIGDMALETQAKILRVLQEQEVYRLGGSKPRPAKARIVSATHQDLAAKRRAGTFRDDLFHRLTDWEVELPPLRQRRSDIGNLAAYFAAREATHEGRRVLGISRKALDCLEAYNWPGNVRQLEREIARAVLFVADGGLLDSNLLSDEITQGVQTEPSSLRELLESTERRAITESIEATGG